MNPSHPIKIWQPTYNDEYLETLNILSSSNKRWIVGNSGKIIEVSFFVFIFEKIKAFFNRIDPTKKELVEYHVIKLLEHGHNHDLLNNQEKKIQKIAQKMNWGHEIILQDLFEQIKTPLEIKVDRITERLSLLIKRENDKKKYSFSHAFLKITRLFERGLITKVAFDKIDLFFKEWQKEWEPRSEQVEELLKRKEYTDGYFNELEDFFEKLVYRYENFYKNLADILIQNQVQIFFSSGGLLYQILLERGLLAYAKDSQQIDEYIQSILAKNIRETLLHLACKFRKLDLVKWLIKKGANLNVSNTSMESPLAVAIENKSTEIARFLIDKGINIHSTDQNGSSHLLLSLVEGNLEIAKLLIEKGANIDERNSTFNPLAFAVFYSKIEMIKWLIRHGASVENKFLTERNCEQAVYINHLLLTELIRVKSETIELWKRIFLSNIWTFSHNTIFLGEEHNLEGGSGRAELKEIARHFTDFQNRFYKNSSVFENVKNILNGGTAFAPTNIKESLEHFKAGKPILLDTGYTGHSIVVVYYGPYLIILNRGGRSKEHALFVRKINREKAFLKEKTWEKLVNGCITSNEAERFFYETLPILSGADREIKSDPIIEAVHQFFINNQAMGNCWLVSPKLSPLAILMISELIKLEESQPAPESIIGSYFYRRKQKKIINDAYMGLYKPFTSFLRLNSLKTYLQEAIEDKENLGRGSIDPDHELIQNVMRKYYLKYTGRFSIFKEIEKEIETLYQKYQTLFDKKPLSTKIPAIVLRTIGRFKPKMHLNKKISNNVWMKHYFPKFRLPNFGDFFF